MIHNHDCNNRVDTKASWSVVRLRVLSYALHYSHQAKQLCLCIICGDRASGYNFDVFSCESCARVASLNEEQCCCSLRTGLFRVAPRQNFLPSQFASTAKVCSQSNESKCCMCGECRLTTILQILSIDEMLSGGLK